MDMISMLNDCPVKSCDDVKSKEEPILFQKLIAKSICIVFRGIIVSEVFVKIKSSKNHT